MRQTYDDTPTRRTTSWPSSARAAGWTTVSIHVFTPSAILQFATTGGVRRMLREPTPINFTGAASPQWPCLIGGWGEYLIPTRCARRLHCSSAAATSSAVQVISLGPAGTFSAALVFASSAARSSLLPESRTEIMIARIAHKKPGKREAQIRTVCLAPTATADQAS